MESPGSQADDDQGQCYDEGRSVEEPVAGASAPPLPTGDGERSPAGGVGDVQRTALRGAPALGTAPMTGGRSTASGCRRRVAAGPGGAPRRLRGRGAHTTIVGALTQPTRREAPPRAQGHTWQAFVEIRRSVWCALISGCQPRCCGLNLPKMSVGACNLLLQGDPPRPNQEHR